MSEHARMIKELCQKPEALSKALGTDRVWVRSIEHTLQSGDRIDIIVQDRPISNVSPDTTCYVIELKSYKGDHEILGQLQKALLAMSSIGEATKHWKRTVGVAIAKKYTASGLQLLLESGMLPFIWREDKDSHAISLIPANISK